MEPPHGTELVGESVYEFHKPDVGQRIEVEIVFMHGLQVRTGDYKRAYYKTWRTRDGTEVWAETWLKEKYKNARILSLCYNSSARTSSKAGNMSPSALGESLLNNLVLTEVGQNGCPVIFVCHSLGGLIAKEIVVRCGILHSRVADNYEKLLRNVKAFFFYATPHQGSDIADSVWVNFFRLLPGVETSKSVKYLIPTETSRAQTHADFLKTIHRYSRDCKFYVVAEGQKIQLPASVEWVVHPNSARFPGLEEVYHELKDADHMTVCKPENRNDGGYKELISCIDHAIKEHKERVEVPLSVAPIGIQGQIDDIKSRLENPEVSVIGLFGMGGIGKTTLSKMFYNDNARDYFKSCYLENVASKQIVDVQKELLQGRCGEKVDRMEKRHLDMIKECLMEQRVLVVIDDVASLDYLKELQVFHALETGSECKCKVIVTGRDKGVFRKKYVTSGKAIIVTMDGINDGKGSDMELFSRYAFAAVGEGARNLDDKFAKKAEEIVKLCNGLPLSLEVIGTYLGDEYDEDLDRWMVKWNEAYDRLHEAKSINGTENDKLWASLRISYDTLGGDEKKMFLEFACFFSVHPVLCDKMICERIWDSIIGIEHLMNRHLLKIKDRNGGGRFVMHDQLRDMGRMIGRKGVSKDDPGIYLWETNKIVELCEADKNNKSTTKVLGLLFDDPRKRTKSSQETSVQSSCDYSQLRLLHLRDCHTPLVDDCLSKCSTELRSLDLQNSRFTQIGSFTGLRVLRISGNDDMEEIPTGIGNLINLRVIELECFSKLLSLPNTIGNLKKLEELCIMDCDEIRTFPDAIGELSELWRLGVSDCYNFQSLPDTIGKLKKLQVLMLDDCSSLQSIPDAVGELSELRKLELFYCPKLKSLPDTIDNLEKLKIDGFKRDKESGKLLPDIGV